MELVLDFEKPIVELEKKLKDLKDLSIAQNVDLKVEIQALEKKIKSALEETFSHLSAWQKVQVSRHPNRPYTKDYIDALFKDFQELSGDRCFGEDAAIICGTALYNGIPVMIIGNQKGRTTKQKMERNFGMARPEGYRKAIRVMELASRFHLPLIHFVDTPGAYPGLDAEERGQAEAIADCIRTLFTLETPTLSIIIGEGGSGGALALAATDDVTMLEHSTYSVISPESCASILWNDSTLAERAASRIKLTAQDLLGYKLIDQIITEPLGGAHRHWEKTFHEVQQTIDAFMNKSTHFLQSLKKSKNSDDRQMLIEKLLENRYQKFRTLGHDQIDFSGELLKNELKAELKAAPLKTMKKEVSKKGLKKGTKK